MVLDDWPFHDLEHARVGWGLAIPGLTFRGMVTQDLTTHTIQPHFVCRKYSYSRLLLKGYLFKMTTPFGVVLNVICNPEEIARLNLKILF